MTKNWKNCTITQTSHITRALHEPKHNCNMDHALAPRERKVEGGSEQHRGLTSGQVVYKHVNLLMPVTWQFQILLKLQRLYKSIPYNASQMRVADNDWAHAGWILHKVEAGQMYLQLSPSHNWKPVWENIHGNKLEYLGHKQFRTVATKEKTRERKNNNITTMFHPEVWGFYIDVGATLTML